jgi:hypothetical protein
LRLEVVLPGLSAALRFHLENVERKLPGNPAFAAIESPNFISSQQIPRHIEI